MHYTNTLRITCCTVYTSLVMIVCGVPYFLISTALLPYIPLHYIQTIFWTGSRIYLSGLICIAGADVKINGLINLDRNKTYIFMCNHTSVYDVPVLYTALPFELIAICKSQLSQVPILGWLLQLCSYIFVEKNDTSNNIIALENGLNHLHLYPKSVLAFPEGRIPEGEDIVPFKSGVFIFAIQSGMPVVPVSINGCRQVFGRCFNIFAKLKPGCITVNIGEPISNINDKNKLLQEVHKQISESYR